MTKEETYDTHVYVEGRTRARVSDRPLPVGMYTDEHSEICSIRFSDSFTLNVVTPQDLIMLAQEIETFGRRAMELHYGDESSRMRAMSEEMTRVQEKLVECLLAPDPVDDVCPTKVTAIDHAIDDILTCPLCCDPEDKVERVMKGMVSGPVWKDPNDPVNW